MFLATKQQQMSQALNVDFLVKESAVEPIGTSGSFRLLAHRCQLWNGLVRPPQPNLWLIDQASYQNPTLGEHADSYSYFNWRTNYNVVFTDHSFSRNSFDTESCITSALRWVIWIVFSFERPIRNPFCYPRDLLAQAEDCAGQQGCVILNLSYGTWLTKNLGH